MFQAIWDKAKSENPSIKPRAIYLRIEQVKKRYKNTISSRMASNILAAEMGIDIHRLLRNNADELKELQELVRAAQPQFIVTNKKEIKKERNTEIVIEKQIVDSFGLPPNLSQEANRMANLYPRMYVIENLIRLFGYG